MPELYKNSLNELRWPLFPNSYIARHGMNLSQVSHTRALLINSNFELAMRRSLQAQAWKPGMIHAHAEKPLARLNSLLRGTKQAAYFTHPRLAGRTPKE